MKFFRISTGPLLAKLRGGTLPGKPNPQRNQKQTSHSKLQLWLQNRLIYAVTSSWKLTTITLASTRCGSKAVACKQAGLVWLLEAVTGHLLELPLPCRDHLWWRRAHGRARAPHPFGPLRRWHLGRRRGLHLEQIFRESIRYSLYMYILYAI